MGRSLILSRILLCISALWLFLSLYLSRMGYCIPAWAYLAFIPLLLAFIVPVWTKEKPQMQELSYACAALLCVALPLALTDSQVWSLQRIFLALHIHNHGALGCGRISAGKSAGAEAGSVEIGPEDLA